MRAKCTANLILLDFFSSNDIGLLWRSHITNVLMLWLWSSSAGDFHGRVLAILSFIRELSGSNPGPHTGYRNRGFRYFPQFLQANSGINLR